MLRGRGLVCRRNTVVNAAVTMCGRRMRVMCCSALSLCQRLCITATSIDAANSAAATAPASSVVLADRSSQEAIPFAAATTPQPSSRDKILSSTPLAVAYPARQNPFVSVLQAADTKLLLANSQYAIFSIAYDSATSTYAVYSATGNQLVTVSQAYLWKAAMWVDERIGEEYIAGLFFGTDASEPVREAVATLVQKTQKRTVQAPDAWGIAYLAFRAQREVVPGVVLPTSLEHAYYLLSHKIFNPALLESTVFDINTGAFAKQGESVKESGAARTALLSWCMLLDVHRRFGTPGSRKTINPIEQIIRRVVKAVSIFVIDIDVRVGRGTIAEGHTMSITIYDAQRRSQSVHAIRSLSEEVAKLNHLTTLLYGEGSSSISLFVPTPRTRAAQTIAFARTCRPKSPFFVVELSSLGQHFGVPKLTEGLTAESDPRTTWSLLRSNCVLKTKSMRKDESKLDRHLQREFTALANKLFNDRLHKVAPAIQSAIRSIPAPEGNSAVSLAHVRQLATHDEAHPVTNICHSTFLNKVNINDAEVVFRLQRWRAAIYDSADRLAREAAAAKLLERYLIVDLETTTVRRYKRIANAFTRENYVVLSGARDYQGKVYMPRCYFDRHVALRYNDPAVTSVHELVAGSSKQSLFLPPLQDYDVLVGHNIKFDLLHMWRDVELRQFLARGGRIWDTMYAEYLLSGQEVKLGSGAGLEDVARSYGGQIGKLDAVKRAWAEGKETYEIPYSVLCEYLHGDLENTELIFRKQCARALQQRQVIICAARMDGLLCTTEMEYNGLKTNVDLAQQHTNELTGKVTELRRRLEDAIPGEIPPNCRKFFNWLSNAHLIYLFFGGKLKLSTNARESRTLPGEAFARHELFAEADSFPAKQYPRGVFLRPPIHVLGMGDCAVLAGVGLEKGTRMFRAYFDAYMRQAGFRKSSTMVDSFRRMMVAVPRINPERRGEVAALANLLPRRHIFLFAALSLDSAGQIVKLFVKNAITAESVTICSSSSNGKADELRAFIRAQVRAHTEMLLAANEDNAASLGSAAFVNAQVTILARDACFSFQRHLRTDRSLMEYFAAHSANISYMPEGTDDMDRTTTPNSSCLSAQPHSDDDATNSSMRTKDDHISSSSSSSSGSGAKSSDTVVDLDDRYDIIFADTIATLAYYIHTYGPRSTQSGTARSTSITPATATRKPSASKEKKSSEKHPAASSLIGRVNTALPAITVIPVKALPRPSKTRLGNAEALRAKLVHEANMKPEEWCNLYMDIFLHIANASLQYDALVEDASKPRAKAKTSGSSSGRGKKTTKTATATSATAAKKTGTKARKQQVAAQSPSDALDAEVEAAAAAAEDEQQLPVLMRRRRAFVGYYNALPDAERKRISLMCLLGRTIASLYDCFAVPCSHDDVVEVTIKGRLATYIPNELEAEQVMRRFRSSATRQLQVGEDTLHYFENTHNDQTAKTILELRALEKLIGTYYESTDGGSGMVALVHSIDSCIHHELIHNKTNTGRLSSANPNCQNIPKEDKSSLRDMFISRYGEKGMCIEADYSQLEVVALAVLAEDEQMLDDLRHNIDFHCKRVTMMRPDLRYTEVLQRAKRNKEPDFVKLRQQAKIFSFQRQYGAGVKMISKSTGLTQDQVHMLIEKERETYRGVDVFNKMVTLSANSFDASLQNGAKNVRGHQFFKGMFPVLTGSRYIFTESDIPESMMHSRYTAKKSTNFSPTHLKNYPVQGFAGEIVQIMLGVLWRHFLKNNNYNSLAVLNNTVHDCVWVDCHESIYRTVAKDVEEIMTNVRKVVNGLFPEINITVDFPCDVMAGESMGSLRAIIEETTL